MNNKTNWDIRDFRFLGIWLFLNLIPSMLKPLGFSPEVENFGFLEILYYIVVNLLIPFILMMIREDKYYNVKKSLLSYFNKNKIVYDMVGTLFALISFTFFIWSMLN